MEIPVLLEPKPGGGFQARSCRPARPHRRGRYARRGSPPLARADRGARRFRRHTDLDRCAGPEVRAPSRRRGSIEMIPSTIAGGRRSTPTARKSRTTRTDHERLCPRYRYLLTLWAGPSESRSEDRLAPPRGAGDHGDHGGGGDGRLVQSAPPGTGCRRGGPGLRAAGRRGPGARSLANPPHVASGPRPI